MIPVATGDDHKFLINQIVELLLLQASLIRKDIPLNGGSDTRTAVIEYWTDIAETLDIPIRVVGRYKIILGDIS